MRRYVDDVEAAAVPVHRTEAGGSSSLRPHHHPASARNGDVDVLLGGSDRPGPRRTAAAPLQETR